MKILHRPDNILAPPPNRAGFERDAMAMNEAIKTMNKVIEVQRMGLMDGLAEIGKTIPERQAGHQAPPAGNSTGDLPHVFHQLRR